MREPCFYCDEPGPTIYTVVAVEPYPSVKCDVVKAHEKCLAIHSPESLYTG